MNKICTDIKQSQKFIELGIDVNSADMYWEYDFTEHECVLKVMDMHFGDTCIPAWSLSALLSVVSEEVSLNSFNDGNWNAAMVYPNGTMIQNSKMICANADNPVDACYKLILKLREQKIL